MSEVLRRPSTAPAASPPFLCLFYSCLFASGHEFLFTFFHSLSLSLCFSTVTYYGSFKAPLSKANLLQTGCKAHTTLMQTCALVYVHIRMRKMPSIALTFPYLAKISSKHIHVVIAIPRLGSADLSVAVKVLAFALFITERCWLVRRRDEGEKRKRVTERVSRVYYTYVKSHLFASLSFFWLDLRRLEVLHLKEGEELWVS